MIDKLAKLAVAGGDADATEMSDVISVTIVFVASFLSRNQALVHQPPEWFYIYNRARSGLNINYSMAEEDSHQVIKRRRVTVACESCRRLKAKVSDPIRWPTCRWTNWPPDKCDGKQPVCSRCAGYGHSCVWNAKPDRHPSRQANREHLFSEPSFTGGGGIMRKQLEIVTRYDELVEDLRSRLKEDDRRAVAVTLANLRQSVSSLPGMDKVSGQRGKSPVSNKTSPAYDDLAVPAQRYLGEASEVRFLNIIKQALSQNLAAQPSLAPTHLEVWDTYEQDEISRHSSYEQNPFLLPSKATADKYLQIFFSTIHIAYPFVCQPTFLEKYEEFWETDAPYNFHGPWLSLLCE